MLDGLAISVTTKMNEELVKPFTILDIFKFVEGMADGKATWHDGIPIEFLIECWLIIGEGFFDMIT